MVEKNKNVNKLLLQDNPGIAKAQCCQFGR